MDKIAHYQAVIKKVFAEYAESRTPSTGFNPGYQLIFDDPNCHYLLYRTSWRDEFRRAHYCVFHADIINDKIWIQEDATDFNLAGELEAHGITKQEIVLAFVAPYKRPYSDYAAL